ncbi:MAG TPA: GGDEF domain-containing protein [Solirubrobacteraceae bacterium]|nr:GGDEF domain-containing protein [Solirubrobacteraceae bacterium]
MISDDAEHMEDVSGNRSWLIRDGMDRERMLDMDRRLQPVRRLSFLVLAGSLILLGPWLGWWTMVPLVATAGLFAAADKHTERARRPEYFMFGAWVGTQVVLAIAVALSGGPKVATISWFGIAVVTLASRFSDRGIAIGVAITYVLMLAVAFGVNAHAVIENPTRVVAPAALIASVTMFSLALMRSDVEHRSRAVVDTLTGMLNRAALAGRAEELAQQSAITSQPVGLIVADIDHFKETNDTYGHAIGDAVLKDVAYIIRKQLRAFDLAYRLGGEEFLVLLPGADSAQVQVVAEGLRTAVAERPLGGGIAVTISCGVAASKPPERFDYEAVFERADRALYAAKRGGRNRVCVAGDAAQGEQPAAGDGAGPVLGLAA